MSEYVLTINGKEYRAEVSEINAEQARITVNGREFQVGLQQLGLSKLLPVETKKGESRTEAAATVPSVRPALEAPPAGGDVSNIVKSPLPGLIVDVKVGAGEKVKAGQVIVTMEAMKMENQIQATIDGTVKKIFVKKGDNVAEGDTLIEIARSDMASL
ncbi:MAG: biotin/lipoyl-binding protein [Candidatus Aminicenantes bacterium]|nr:biotin/lipoyl-binding protein [Candidatus Aminicenantes bacterium]